MAKVKTKAGPLKMGKKHGPYIRRGISDPKKMERVPATPNLDQQPLDQRHGGAHPKREESKVTPGGVLNRKKTIDTFGMKYLKG